MDNLFIPILKGEKEYIAILSDTSLDRDDELISPELIKKWGSNPNKYLPILIDHENRAESLVGKWINHRIITKIYDGEEHIALSLQPRWFEHNPKAKMIKGMIEEDGAEYGLSIGARPLKSSMVKRGKKEYKMWTDAELLEGSITPIPSNSNCMIMAKGWMNKMKTSSNDFPVGTNYSSNEGEIPALVPTDDTEKSNVQLTKPKKLEDCVKSLMADPKFKPKKGRTKRESAYAVCQASIKSRSTNQVDNLNKKEEKMSEEQIEEQPKEPEPVPEPKEPEEPKEDKMAKMELLLKKQSEMIEKLINTKPVIPSREEELTTTKSTPVEEPAPEEPEVKKALSLKESLSAHWGIWK